MGRELRKTIVDGVDLWAVHETVIEVEDAITPGFRTKAELVEHLVARGTEWDGPWPREAAEDFVNRTGWAPSFIIGPPGVKKGYEQPSVPPKKGGGDDQDNPD